MSDSPRFTVLGKAISFLLVIGLVALGAFMLMRGGDGGTPSAGTETEGGDPEISEVKVEVPRLSPPAAFNYKDNIVPIEISEYAGYAGLIAANGGLEPSENSLFFKNHGFKVKLTVSEDESWSALNEGKIAGSVTTVDVLAAYGRQLHAVVPAQIGFSRGADGLIVKTDIKRINQLKGKTIAAAQFTEVDFFIRYLAQEAGLPINTLGSLDSTPHLERLNLIYVEDGFAAGDLFASDLKSGKNRLAGAVTWEPKVSEVVDGSGGKAHVLTTNRNLLIVADVLILHRGFAEQNPKVVEGLVQGLLEGNRMVRDRPDTQLDVIARAFKWTREDAKSELANVHLSNLPENRAFFSGAIDAAGSFGGIYQSAVLAYGSDLIKDPPDASHFLRGQALEAIEKTGLFKDQTIAIAPIRSGGGASVESDPLLSKDIRFLFEPNLATLDMSNQDNVKSLETIKRMLAISPGSTMLLRGHVDNAQVAVFRQTGGEAYVRTQALRAMELSKNRAGEIRKLLIERYGIDAKRLDIVGRGWEEPAGPESAQNRRVEVQWFTIE
ncbi:MAG: phosphate ABC transporter substrate-binding/OmpA family protein [Acidobacteriota bacterium]|nr:OmpA family protein [Acidobacteriota bacterium]MDQ3419680.1 phosphate ABC transporter substrate-binding/OmpA family protein [Acidobacteriota bacterium]